eukprot:535877_1
MAVCTFYLILCMLCKFGNGDIINPIADFWIPDIGIPGAESIAIDTVNQRIFAADPASSAVHIFDFAFDDGDFTSATITETETPIDIKTAFLNMDSPITVKDITSIVYSSEGGYVAACVAPESHAQTPGWLAFISTSTLDVFNLLEMPDCYLPDHVSVTNNGNTLVISCEGEPNDNYVEDPDHNPEGVVAIVDASESDHNDWSVSHADFNRFDEDQDLINELYFSHQSESLSVNAEPEYSAISLDDKFAYISLQELNAIAALDLETKEIIGVYPLGVNDFSVYGLDASDKDGKINIMTYENVYGMRAPDGIDYLYSPRSNRHYLFTANEGDSKDFDEVRVGDVNLSANTFGNYDIEELQMEEHLGRLKVSNLYGKNGEDEFEALYAFSSRDFTIWEVKMVNGRPDRLKLHYSSDNLFELITAVTLGKDGFNSDYEYDTFDERSDAKGPEPESIVVGKCSNGRQYVFIGLERVGGIVVFDITKIDRKRIEYREYYNARNFNFAWTGEEPPEEAGHFGPEQLRFIEEDVYGVPLLFVAYPESSSVAMYRIDCEEMARLIDHDRED